MLVLCQLKELQIKCIYFLKEREKGNTSLHLRNIRAWIAEGKSKCKGNYNATC